MNQHKQRRCGWTPRYPYGSMQFFISQAGMVSTGMAAQPNTSNNNQQRCRHHHHRRHRHKISLQRWVYQPNSSSSVTVGLGCSSTKVAGSDGWRGQPKSTGFPPTNNLYPRENKNIYIYVAVNVTPLSAGSLLVCKLNTCTTKPKNKQTNKPKTQKTLTRNEASPELTLHAAGCGDRSFPAPRRSPDRGTPPCWTRSVRLAVQRSRSTGGGYRVNPAAHGGACSS